jgi:hypothetical protein
LSYLDPPPLPAPVIVTKDFGGLVTDYQARTEEYRATNREVRVHECHSACTLALSLPNVCVYPNSIFKFHQAYNARNHITDDGVSAQLFNAYPSAVQARLGVLTRDFKILNGTQLIQLGVRDCNEPRIMVASVGKTVERPLDQSSSLTSMVHGWMGTLTGSASPARPEPLGQPLRVVSREPSKPAPSDVVFADFPMPPARPPALVTQPEPSQGAAASTDDMKTSEGSKPTDAPLPPERPPSLSLTYAKQLPVAARLRIIGGAAPILKSNTFVAFAALPR